MRTRTILSLSLACVTWMGCGADDAPPSATSTDGSSSGTSGADGSTGATSSGGLGSSSDSGGSSSSSSSGADSSSDTSGSACEDRECVDPPSASCSDAFTVATPAAAGACVDGECAYEETLADCPYGCDEAQCVCVTADVCTGGSPRAATAWWAGDEVQQPRIASLGCSQVVAARATVGGQQRLRLWIVDHQGTVLDETTLDVPGDRLDVTADHGVIALAWHDAGRITGALLDLALSPIATDIPLSPEGRQLRSPAIAPTSDGSGFVTVYYGEDGTGGFGLFAQTIDRTGAPVGTEHDLGEASGQLTSGCYTFPDVATGAGGTMAVWSHCESGARSVYAVPLEASGAAASPAQLVAEASAGSIAPSRVAVADFQDRFAVTYNDDRLAAVPNSGDVYVAVLDAAAQVQVGPNNATQGTWGGGKFWPEIVGGPDQLVLSWYSPEATPGDRRVLFSVVDAATAMRVGPLVDASIETGDAPFFHLYPSPFVGPEGFGVVLASTDELLMVGRSCSAPR